MHSVDFIVTIQVVFINLLLSANLDPRYSLSGKLE